jgi:hypothetical protein
LALRNIDLFALRPEAVIEGEVSAWSGLVEVEFPANLQSIGNVAFKGYVWLAPVRLPWGLDSIRWNVFKDDLAVQQLALGDFRTWPKEAAEMINGGGKLDRLELIGRNLKRIPAAAIERWFADNAVVLGAAFKGGRLGLFEIISE